MTSLILAALLSQTQPTQAQLVGAANTIIAAWQDRANRTITANADRTRICVGPATGSTLTGRTTVRLGVVVLSQDTQTRLAMPTVTGEAYGAAEIQIDPAQPTDRLIIPLRALDGVVQIIREEIEVRASPLVATAEVCLVRRDAPEITSATLYRCACLVTTSCKLADGTTTAPQGVTLGPGQFTSSVACQRKPCVTRFDGAGVDASWPAACPR